MTRTKWKPMLPKLAVSMLRELADKIERNEIHVLELTEKRSAVPVDESGLGVMVQMVPDSKVTVLVSYEEVATRRLTMKRADNK